MKLIFFVLIACPVWSGLLAQDTLSAGQFLSIVKQFHPVVKQATLSVQAAATDVLQARSAFDPNMQAGTYEKVFSDITYYQYRQATLNIPTWYGIEVGAGVEYVNGSRLDPQETPGTSNFLGIQIPLLKNLLIDKRRAALKQAKIYQELSLVERRAIINDILYDALSRYWYWVEQSQRLSLVRESLENSRQRLAFTKQVIQWGERPAIDSFEAQIQVQTLEAQFNEAQTDQRNALLELSAFTWTEDGLSVDLPTDLQPASVRLESAFNRSISTRLDDYETLLLDQHPEILQYDFKLQALQVKQRLNMQELLPKLDVKYNFLGKGNAVWESPFQPVLQNNYQYGLSFQMPLRLSAGRAAFRLGRIQIQDNQFGQNNKRRQLITKLRQSYNDWLLIEQQIRIYQEMVMNQIRLTNGEDTRFRQGEGSLFLINARELKQLELRQKLLELTVKFYKQEVKLGWVTGVLGQD